MVTDTQKSDTSLDIERIKSALDMRQHDARPMSHSVAVAYRQVIAAREARSMSSDTSMQVSNERS